MVFAQDVELHPNPEVPVWNLIFNGIEKTQSMSLTPQLQQVYAIRIDTTINGISFFSTPRAEENYEPEKRETVRQQADTFLQTYELQVAVNANFFTIPKGETYSTSGIANLVGLAVSEGKVVSPPAQKFQIPLFCIFKDGQIKITEELPETNLSNISTAVAGGPILCRNGKILIPSISNSNGPIPVKDPNGFIHPRTAIGISQDKRYVLLLVIDGRCPNYSVGATLEETGAWLRFFGAWDGLNLDGGGSTTLVVQGEAGKPIVLNRPSDKILRYNGNHLGIRALPLSQQP
ncbi:MAG: phosphodiester glycosidase family protein [Planctomycetaceae bacterium]|nr:phosphodiester glycosidase family protein [Planctomycetaceae bacterium]